MDNWIQTSNIIIGKLKGYACMSVEIVLNTNGKTLIEPIQEIILQQIKYL